MADKSFGVKELNLLNASGTPTVTSPNNLNLNANTVAISTSCTIGSNLTVSGDIDVDSQLNVGNNIKIGNAGVVTATSFVGNGAITINNNGTSKIITGSGTANTLNANVNLTFDGTTLDVKSGTGNINAGIVTATTFSGNPSNDSPHSLWDVVNNSASSYRFTGPGQDGAEDNPDIYLVRGQRYLFKMNASGHPFQIRVANGGAAYSDGVTNNGAQTGNVVFNVQHDAPAQLYYQCTSHGGMVGNIYIVGGPQVISGVVTATTFSGNLSGGTVSGTTGTFTNNLSVAQNIVHTGDTDTKIEFLTDTICFDTAGSERFRITSGGLLQLNNDAAKIQLGASQDLSIYHDGSSNRIIAANADLLLQSNNYSIRSENGSSTYLNISSTGAVTKPTQPCAVVYQCTGPAGGAANASSDNQEPLHFDHVHINQGGMTISQDNGRIEVPVTGIYFVSYMVSGTVTNVDTNDGIELLLLVNGNEYPATNSGAEPVFNFGAVANQEEFAANNTLLVSLTGGDYVEVALDNIGNSDASINRGNFSIMLMA